MSINPLHLSKAIQSSIWILACRDQDLKSVIDILSLCLEKLKSNQTSLLDSSNVKLIVHCSGSHSRKILHTLQDTFGTSHPPSISQLHPLQAIRGDHFDSLEGTAFLNDLEQKKNDDKIHLLLKYLITDLGGWSLRFPNQPSPDHHLLYHTGAICASNLSLLCLDMGCVIFQELGWTQQEALKALIPLVQGNMSRVWNTPQYPDLKKILTGPLVREDHLLLNRQLEVLDKRFPNSPLSHLYKQWLSFAWMHIYQVPFPFQASQKSDKIGI